VDTELDTLPDLWLARFGHENVRVHQLDTDFWFTAKTRLRDAHMLFVFVDDLRRPMLYRLREKQPAPEGATTKE
jgi:hypothetical protein